MYLSDRDLRSILPEIAFQTSDPTLPFDPDEQIQPCSVDLRLDGVFWRQVSRRPIDLRRSKLLEMSPRRHWVRIDLKPGQCVTLQPGEMLLGRTFEAFSIPARYAGKLEGRSSFARMGLAVHCSADFINPGYRGHMPLELLNQGKSPLRVFPHVPICQVMFIPLSSTPERVYGARELSSKYMDDDGGPSYWWRDKRVKQVQAALGEHDVAEAMQQELLEVIAPSDPELIERFERLLQQLPRSALTNTSDLLQRFAEAENKVRLWARLLRGIQISAAPFLIAIALGSLFAGPYELLHYISWSLAAGAVPVSVVGLKSDLGDYFTTAELARARGRQASAVSHGSVATALPPGG